MSLEKFFIKGTDNVNKRNSHNFNSFKPSTNDMFLAYNKPLIFSAKTALDINPVDLSTN